MLKIGSICKAFFSEIKVASLKTDELIITGECLRFHAITIIANKYISLRHFVSREEGVVGGRGVRDYIVHILMLELV